MGLSVNESDKLMCCECIEPNHRILYSVKNVRNYLKIEFE